MQLSNDRGATWTKAVQGAPVEFSTEGTTIGYRVKMGSPGLNLTPSFDNITIYYKVRSYPTDPSLDIGAMGAPIWNWTGPFGIPGQPAVIDFTARLNASLESEDPGPDGRIKVPFVVSSGSLGTLWLQNLSVQYDLAPSAPVLKDPADGEYIIDPMPTFKLLAYDNDTTSLQFRIDISQDNFSTVKRSYNQRSSPDGWDKEYYQPGELAAYHLASTDRLAADGAYQWRAYVYDGTVWSAASAMGVFRLDTKPPTARVLGLPAYENVTEFRVCWTGSDPDPGSGLATEATYDIQYKDRESSPWTGWLEGTNETSAEFTGIQGKTYYFQARARDAAGNTGQYIMGNGDMKTVVDISPPAGNITDDGITTADHTRLHATFSFIDSESGVVQYMYWVGTRQGLEGNDTYDRNFTDKKDVTVTGLSLKNGTRYFFTVSAKNGAGIWSGPVSSDGIIVRLKIPVASVDYEGGPQRGPNIELWLGGTDPNNLGIAAGDLEYRAARVQSRVMVNWSDWTEAGESDWGGPKPGQDPYVFTGEPGKAYRFRYRVRDGADAYSDYSDPGNVTRINRPPVPVISAPSRAKTGEGIDFLANGSHDPDGDRLNYTWAFGDGKMGYGREARHSYSAGKKYTVTLYVDDNVENVSVQMAIQVASPPSSIEIQNLAVPLALMAVAVGVAAGAYVAASRRRRKTVVVPVSAGTGTAPLVVPGSERVLPLPPVTRPEAEAQIAAAKEAVAELEQLEIETTRTRKMLGLAESFLTDGNLDMASQYAKKTAKLSRDQKQRKESEVDEETARRFVNETQKLVERTEALGINVKEAKKLFGLSISFLAEGNYVTGMQYSKKVRKILEELMERQAALPATGESVDAELEFLRTAIAELRRSGEDTEELEKELETARTFLQAKDFQPAMEHLSKARGLALDLKDRGRPFTPQQWKDKLNLLKQRIDREKDEGLRIEEPVKMLKFSESFALQGNLEVASQYLRKAEMLLNDMGDRAMVEAQRREAPAKAAPACPRCGEEVEADWVVCAFCNTRLKAETPAVPAVAEPPKEAIAPPRPHVIVPKLGGEILVAKPVDDAAGGGAGDGGALAGKTVKVAHPVENAADARPQPEGGGPPADERPPASAGDLPSDERPPASAGVLPSDERPPASAGDLPSDERPPVESASAPDGQPVKTRCPSCGTDLEPGWKVCPVCEFPV